MAAGSGIVVVECVVVVMCCPDSRFVRKKLLRQKPSVSE